MQENGSQGNGLGVGEGVIRMTWAVITTRENGKKSSKLTSTLLYFPALNIAFANTQAVIKTKRQSPRGFSFRGVRQDDQAKGSLAFEMHGSRCQLHKPPFVDVSGNKALCGW